MAQAAHPFIGLPGARGRECVGKLAAVRADAGSKDSVNFCIGRENMAPTCCADAARARLNIKLSDAILPFSMAKAMEHSCLNRTFSY